MKTKNVPQKNAAPIYPSYFVGSSLHDLLLKTTHMLMSDSYLNESVSGKVTITPLHHPLKYKMAWVYKVGKVKMCTVHFEEDENSNGKYNRCYLVWHNHSEVHFVDLYKRVYGLPDWVKTKEDRDWFFRVA